MKINPIFVRLIFLIMLHPPLYAQEQEGDVIITQCLDAVGDYYFTEEQNKSGIATSCPIETKSIKHDFYNLLDDSHAPLVYLNAHQKAECRIKWQEVTDRAARETQIYVEQNPQIGQSPFALFIRNSYFDGQYTALATQKYFKERDTDTGAICGKYMSGVSLSRGAILSQFLNSDISNIDPALTPHEKWAAWLTILHADNHIEIQRKFSKIFIFLAQQGDFDGHKAAMLADRIRMMQKEKLLYGVLYNCEEGQLVQNLDDMAAVDQRRGEINLPPYKIWLQEQLAAGVCRSK